MNKYMNVNKNISVSRILKLIFFGLILFNLSLSAQMMGELNIMPRHIHFNSGFERIQTVTIRNMGQQEVTIDSLGYDSALLFIRNGTFADFPVTLAHDSFLTFDVILTNYIGLPEDTTSVINVFNSGEEPIVPIEVSVGFMMNSHPNGEIKGSVADSAGAISGAELYFFLNGNYLIDSTTSNQYGYYDIELPEGNYFAAAYKSGYYMQYNGFKDSPLEADFVEINRHDSATVDFLLEPEISTGISVSGEIIDVTNGAGLDKSVVVVRKGKHNPTKINALDDDNPERSYTILTNSSGLFRIDNIRLPGYYYIEAFSQYYIPGYFNNMNNPTVFWQDADSVSIFGLETGKDIYLDRDSSYGAGVTEGSISISGGSPDTAGDATVFAVSETNGRIYNFNYLQSSGGFQLPDLPYGEYRLYTDKIGFEKAVSQSFVISADQDSILNISITLVPVSVINDISEITGFHLEQNYPNPFSKGAGGNPVTTLEFAIPKESNISVKVYDLTGQLVQTFIQSEKYTPGTYKINFNAHNLAAGVYIYSLITEHSIISKKMILLK